MKWHLASSFRVVHTPCGLRGGTQSRRKCVTATVPGPTVSPDEGGTPLKGGMVALVGGSVVGASPPTPSSGGNGVRSGPVWGSRWRSVSRRCVSLPLSPPPPPLRSIVKKGGPVGGEEPRRKLPTVPPPLLRLGPRKLPSRSRDEQRTVWRGALRPVLTVGARGSLWGGSGDGGAHIQCSPHGAMPGGRGGDARCPSPRLCIRVRSTHVDARFAGAAVAVTRAVGPPPRPPPICEMGRPSQC